MIDHLLWGVPDLAAGIDGIARRSGLVPAPGGRHPGNGTANALLGLGGETYLEVIGPDPDGGEGPLGERLRQLEHPGLVGWAARTADADRTAADARAAGLSATVVAMDRTTPQGATLSWRLVFVGGHEGGHLVPFLIDWSDTPHPSATAPSGLVLDRFHLEARRPDPVREALAALGLDVPVESGPKARLAALATGPGGALALDGAPIELGLGSPDEDV